MSDVEVKVAKKAKKAPAKKDAPKKASKAAKNAAVSDGTLYDIISRPVVTEKSTTALEQNKVTFKVPTTATKPRIKQAVEELFGVTVVGVNTILTKGKVKRFRGMTGKRSDVKKAIVTLKAGEQIDFEAGVK